MRYCVALLSAVQVLRKRPQCNLECCMSIVMMMNDAAEEVVIFEQEDSGEEEQPQDKIRKGKIPLQELPADKIVCNDMPV